MCTKRKHFIRTDIFPIRCIRWIESDPTDCKKKAGKAVSQTSPSDVTKTQLIKRVLSCRKKGKKKSKFLLLMR